MHDPIHHSDWSTTCHSRVLVFSDLFTQHVNSRNQFELSIEATIFGRKWTDLTDQGCFPLGC